MNTSNLELSRELFELSGWDETGYEYSLYDRTVIRVEGKSTGSPKFVPAYDAGYLLRKLPPSVFEGDNWVELSNYLDDDLWSAKYTDGLELTKFDERLTKLSGIGGTPEDALAMLAVQMFKQGILPISGRDL